MDNMTPEQMALVQSLMQGNGASQQPWMNPVVMKMLMQKFAPMQPSMPVQQPPAE